MDLNGLQKIREVLARDRGDQEREEINTQAIAILKAPQILAAVQACIPQMLAGDNIIKGNGVVNQTASISYLTAPMLGGIMYAAFGLKPVMYAGAACFFITALFECFIKLGHQQREYQGNVLSMVKDDFLSSIRFITKERADIMKLLLLAALSRFFVMGVTMVGIPFIVQTILGLDATYYGGAESALAVATILGSIAAGFLRDAGGNQYFFLFLPCR